MINITCKKLVDMIAADDNDTGCIFADKANLAIICEYALFACEYGDSKDHVVYDDTVYRLVDPENFDSYY